MSFEELFEEIMTKAKSVADTAGRVTSEVVDMGKLRYQIKQTQWDIEKTYSKLGAIVYESKKSAENFDEVITLAIGEIDSLNEKLSGLEERLRAHKKVKRCASCGKDNDAGNAFCSRCGAALDEKPEAPDAAGSDENGQ
jgi:chromosome segregation ATPase